MNKFLLYLLFTAWPFIVFPQASFRYYPGYVIFKNNDTLFTKIAIDNKAQNVELSNLYVKVVYLDSKNNLDTAFSDATDLIGYSFKRDTAQYNFRKMVFGNYKKNKYPGFAWCLVDGYLKLYSYAYDLRLDHFSWSKSLYQNANPNAVMHEYTKNKVLNYYFQKGNGELVQVPKTSDNSPNKKWLKQFFKDDDALKDKIGTEINVFDLEEMAKQYNTTHS